MISTQACRLTVLIGVVVLVGYVLIVSSDSNMPIVLRKSTQVKKHNVVFNPDEDITDDMKVSNLKTKIGRRNSEDEDGNNVLEQLINFQQQEMGKSSKTIRKMSQKEENGNELMFTGDEEKQKKEKSKSEPKPKRRSKHLRDSSVNENQNQKEKPVKLKSSKSGRQPNLDIDSDVNKMEQIMKVKQPVKLKRGKKVAPRKPKVVPEQKLSVNDRKSLHQKLIRSFGPNYKRSKHYQTIVKKCSEYKQHPGRVLFYDVSPYIETQPHLCDGAPDILLAVHTRPYNFQRRQLIRDTFGSMRYIKGKRVILAFFIGRPRNNKIKNQIRQEAKDYRDIIQRDFKEHYRNMTYKHLTVMDWIMEHCSNVKYLVKVDDDVFVNVFQVIDYIDSFNPNSFYCTRTTGPKPMRKSGKWKVTFDEYSRPTFPPYCMGYAYVMKASLAKDLYWCSVYSKFLWIDDVLIGGLLPEKLRIHLVRFISGHDSAYLLPSHASWKIADHMFLLGTRNELLPGVIRKIWRSSLQFSY